MRSKDDKLCPSYVAVPNALIIGVVDGGGRTRLADEVSVLQQSAIDKLSKSVTPVEHQVRLAGICVKGACQQWGGDVCSLGSHVITYNKFGPYEGYKNCAIKDRCRWRAEHGSSVCPKCTLVIRYGTNHLITSNA